MRQRLGIDDRAKVRPRRARASYSCFSGEQIGAGRRELHVGSGVVYFQPAPFNGELQAGAVLRGRALVAEQKGAVEFFRRISGHPELVRKRARAQGGASRLADARLQLVAHH